MQVQHQSMSSSGSQVALHDGELAPALAAGVLHRETLTGHHRFPVNSPDCRRSGHGPFDGDGVSGTPVFGRGLLGEGPGRVVIMPAITT